MNEPILTAHRSHLALCAVLALLLALGLTACGGGGGEGSGSASTDATRSHGEEQREGGARQGEGSGEGDSGSGGGGSAEPRSGARAGEAAEFTPRQHDDSGGGSQQFRQKGGDNSVQEFGKEADTQEFDAAAAALHNFLDARAEGNWAATCDYMAKSVVESFEKLTSQSKRIGAAGCAGILEKLTNPAAKSAMKQEARQADVGSLRVEGDRAFVIYTGPGGTILAMPMANEEGAWKVAGLAGTPLN